MLKTLENGQVMSSEDGVSWTHYDMEYHIRLQYDAGVLTASIYNYLNEPQSFDGVGIVFDVDGEETTVKSKAGQASIQCIDYKHVYVTADKYRGAELSKPVDQPSQIDVLGQEITQMKIKDMQQQTIIDGLGKELTNAKLEIMELKGGQTA